MNENSAAMQKQSEADELKTLADKFLASKGATTKPEDAKKADAKGLGSMNILIAIPSHSGEVKAKCVSSLLNLTKKLQEIGIRYEVEIIGHCPIIGVVRNYFANKVAFDLDKEGLFGFSHLLFIDSDSANYEHAVMALISQDKAISGLVYATKAIYWEKIESAVRQGIHTNHLAEFGSIPDVDAYGPFDVNRLARVRHIGTGTLLVQKKVFRDLAEKHPEWKYLVRSSYFFGRPNPDREFQYDFFQTKIDPETKNYVCEDQFFNDAAREIGDESYALAAERTYHVGTYDFILNLPLVASHPRAGFM
jgi:hypothetical protein